MKEPDSRLLYALRLLFTPLANVLIKNRISIGPVIEQLKIAYVTAAQKHHGANGKPASVNKIAGLTGMSRGHVSSLLAKAKQLVTAPFVVYTQPARIIAAWATLDDYLNESGEPRRLELGPGRGSLYELAEVSVGPEMRDAAIQTLIDSINVRKCEDDRYELVDRKYSVGESLADILAGGPAALMSTIDKNWDKPALTGFAQHCCYTQELGAKKLLKVRRVSWEHIEHAIKAYDDFICGLEGGERGSFQSPEGDEVLTVGIGAYYFETDYM